MKADQDLNTLEKMVWSKASQCLLGGIEKSRTRKALWRMLTMMSRRHTGIIMGPF